MGILKNNQLAITYTSRHNAAYMASWGLCAFSSITYEYAEANDDRPTPTSANARTKVSNKATLSHIIGSFTRSLLCILFVVSYSCCTYESFCPAGKALMTYDSFDAFTAHQLCRRATLGYDAMKKNYPGRRLAACG